DRPLRARRLGGAIPGGGAGVRGRAAGLLEGAVEGVGRRPELLCPIHHPALLGRGGGAGGPPAVGLEVPPRAPRQREVVIALGGGLDQLVEVALDLRGLGLVREGRLLARADAVSRLGARAAAIGRRLALGARPGGHGWAVLRRAGRAGGSLEPSLGH